MRKGNKAYIHYEVILITLSLIFQFSCNKNWLDVKPNKSLVVPSTVQDFQAILDNTNVFNSYAPALGELASDSYYLLYNDWQSSTPIEQQTYIWSDDPFQGNGDGDWNDAYNRILAANIVLEGIDNIKSDSSPKANWNNVKGSALFYRSFDFFNLAQIFCKPYNPNTADKDLGLPLRLSSDVNLKSVRASLQQTYDKIINDLIEAANLIPITPLYKTRPSKPAVYALLARVYLTMQNYSNALAYSDSCLQLQGTLMNYNTLNPMSSPPIGRFNSEVIFHATLEFYFDFYPSKQIIDSTLYNLYDNNDLRKVIFFRKRSNAMRFYGNYNGAINPPTFGGLATDEIYLIRAECYARSGDTAAAMKDLNTLLINRYKTGTFIPVSALSQNDALSMVLMERRKELVFRGVRWMDLRRLNTDSRFSVTLTRVLNGRSYSLPPNDPRYVFPIPPDEIRLSGIQQNPR